MAALHEPFEVKGAIEGVLGTQLLVRSGASTRASDLSGSDVLRRVRDSNIPVQASIPIIKAALKRAGNTDYTIKVFPTGRHDLVEGENGGPKESARMKRYAPGFWSTMTDWLMDRLTASAR